MNPARCTAITPDSNGWRSASSATRENSAASSRNNTPRCARAIAPGLAARDPPPTSAATDALWCGASSGGRESSADTASPLSERTDATSSASSSSSAGMMPGRRRASIVFPAPGGPLKSKWCPPAAATTRASTASSCPITSARSRASRELRVSDATSTNSTSGTSTSAPCQTATSARDPAARTSIPGTSLASASFPYGTIAVSNPARAAAKTAGRTPGTGRILPSRPSSPIWTVRAMERDSTAPPAARHATATPRSNPAPCFGRLAGERLTVSRRRGRSKPAFLQALCTRWTASPNDLSGRPMIRNSGVWLDMSASTSTRCPSTPVSATAQVRAVLTRCPRDARAHRWSDRLR